MNSAIQTTKETKHTKLKDHQQKPFLIQRVSCLRIPTYFCFVSLVYFVVSIDLSRLMPYAHREDAGRSDRDGRAPHRSALPNEKKTG